jgi:hypothetical protein
MRRRMSGICKSREFATEGRWIMRGLPSGFAWLLRWITGVDKAMESWLGPTAFARENTLTNENGKGK